MKYKELLNYISVPLEVTSGVSHRSVLGPILYLFYLFDCKPNKPTQNPGLPNSVFRAYNILRNLHVYQDIEHPFESSMMSN